jgi:SAM-dependent methyltransferase
MNVLFSTNRFRTNLDGFDDRRIDNEVDFIRRQLPQQSVERVLQLHCGHGHHARKLGQVGYRIIATNQKLSDYKSTPAISKMDANFIVEDMRRLAHPPASFDAVLFLWQSFGFFSERSNRDILRQIRTLLQPGGRLVLDLYQPTFFEGQIGTRQYLLDDVMVTEKKMMRGGRLNVVISYEGQQEPEVYNWRLYSPFEVVELAELYGFHLLLTCTNFLESAPPSREHPRVQYVMEKPRLMM